MSSARFHWGVLWAEDIHPDKACGTVDKMRTENGLAAWASMSLADKPAWDANRGFPIEQLFPTSSVSLRLQAVDKAVSQAEVPSAAVLPARLNDGRTAGFKRERVPSSSDPRRTLRQLEALGAIDFVPSKSAGTSLGVQLPSDQPQSRPTRSPATLNSAGILSRNRARDRACDALVTGKKLTINRDRTSFKPKASLQIRPVSFL
jgi:hypothetical protein